MTDTLEKVDSEGLTARLVDVLLREEALDGEMLHYAKRHFVDTLGAIIAGTPQEVTRRAASVITKVQGPGPFRVPGLGGSFGLLDAAYLSGVAAHGTETDDGYRQGSVHPGTVVVPSILPLAVGRKSSGHVLLSGIVAGYHSMAVIAALAHPKLRRQGFHPTAAVGPLGAAMAATSLLKLDRTKRLFALGIAASSASGLFAFKGGGADVKRLHPGQAARDGLLAALLAEEGCEGPSAVLECSDGFFQALAGITASDLVSVSFPQKPPITDCYIKPYACCRHIHPAVDALRALCEQHAVQSHEIEAIEVETYSIAADHGKVPWNSLAEAQLSFPYVLAAAIKFETLGVRAFEEVHRTDAELTMLCRKVDVRATDEMDARYPAERPARVTLHSSKGSWSEERGEARGDPRYPLDDNEIAVKFLDLVGPVLGSARAGNLLEELWRLEDIEDMTSIFVNLGAAK
ncbi:MmgE/PrpD family protein [Fodinicurvata halophila]|uniref:MmgE/PrpD family protein n=1 Tax=Fodinicurvata halophila TaxID=1419723 RepID=A0ABV8US57_9PROT